MSDSPVALSTPSETTFPPTVTKRRRDSGEEDVEDQTGADETEMVEDAEAQAALEAAKKKQATRPRGPNDPWKSADLHSLELIAKHFVSRYDAKKAAAAKKYVMVFCSIPGTKNLTIQDQAQLANDFAQFEEKEDREKRLALEKEEAIAAANDETGKRTKNASAVPINKKDDWLVTFADSEYTKNFGFWANIDAYIKNQCKEGAQAWWGRTMNDQWLKENYNAIYSGHMVDKDGKMINKEDKPVLYPQVRIKVQVDRDTGKPQFEFKDEQGEVLYRHSCHKDTLDKWAIEDKAWEKKATLKAQGEARQELDAERKAGKLSDDQIKEKEDAIKNMSVKRPFISVDEVKKILVRGSVIRFLWGYRGFGYAKSLNKVANFGSVTRIQIVNRSAADSNPDFVPED